MADANGRTLDPRTEAAQPVTVSVVVPSYLRPDDLARCLRGLAAQTVEPEEILVVLRPEDSGGRAAAQGAPCDVRVVPVRISGQVAALNQGCDAARGSVIAFTDDDAVPHPGWVESLASRFSTDPRIGAVGGRDVVYWRGEIIGGEAETVGRVRWWGRRIGNHHLESTLQDVDFLKGANMALRASARQPFDARLLGPGAQVCNDMEVSWSIRRRGWRVVWDPGVRIDHFPAEREDDDKRESRSVTSECHACHNEIYGVLRHAAWWQRPIQFGYHMIIGSRQAPGILTGARAAREPAERRRVLVLARARLRALGTLRR